MRNDEDIMLLYGIVALWPLIIKYIYNRAVFKIGQKNVSKIWFIVLAVIPMLSLIAFRDSSLGADTGQYLINFVIIRDGSFKTILANSRMEDGYLYFVKIITYITDSPEVFQVIYASIYAISLVILMKEFEDNCFDFLFFYGTLGLYMFMFTGVRQCLAMSMCIIAYRFAVKRKIVWFALFVILACAFHRSAILFAVVYFVIRWKIKWYTISLYAISAFFAVTFLGIIQGYFSEAMDYNYTIENAGNGGIFFVYILLLIVFSIYIAYTNGFNEKITGLANLSIITLLFWVLRLYTVVAERESYYFLFYVCAFIPSAVNGMENKRDESIYKLLIYGSAFVLYIYRLLTNFSSFVPYQSFF